MSSTSAGPQVKRAEDLLGCFFSNPEAVAWKRPLTDGRGGGGRGALNPKLTPKPGGGRRKEGIPVRNSDRLTAEAQSHLLCKIGAFGSRTGF